MVEKENLASNKYVQRANIYAFDKDHRSEPMNHGFSVSRRETNHRFLCTAKKLFIRPSADVSKLQTLFQVLCVILLM